MMSINKGRTTITNDAHADFDENFISFFLSLLLKKLEEEI